MYICTFIMNDTYIVASFVHIMRDHACLANTYFADSDKLAITFIIETYEYEFSPSKNHQSRLPEVKKKKKMCTRV